MRRRLSDFVTPDPDRTAPFQIPTPVSRTHVQVSDPSLTFAARGLAFSRSDTLPSAYPSQNGALNDEGHAPGDPRPSFSRSATTIPAHVRKTSMQNESPLLRAGLLQSKSFNASLANFGNSGSGGLPSHSSAPGIPQLHKQDTIRFTTMQLSNMPFIPNTHTNEALPTQTFPATLRTFPDNSPTHSQRGTGGFIFPVSSPILSPALEMDMSYETETEPAQSRTSSPPPSSLSQSISSLPISMSESDSEASSLHPPPTPVVPPSPQQPSGLSLLRPRASSLSSATPSREDYQGHHTYTDTTPIATPRPVWTSLVAASQIHDGERLAHIPEHASIRDPPPSQVLIDTPDEHTQTQYHVHWRNSPPSPVHSALSQSRSLSSLGADLSGEQEERIVDERTPLLLGSANVNGHLKLGGAKLSHNTMGSGRQHLNAGEGTPGQSDYSVANASTGLGKASISHIEGNIRAFRKTFQEEVISKSPHHLKTALRAIPAVLLGCLLNILDGVSYGMIIFPATGVFADLGGMGVSMFFLSTVIAQLVFTLGGSGFAGANGSMMIEVVPFFHILASSIASQIGEDKPREIIATTLAAYALSSILTGLSFFLLGALKLGVIVGFFPRHILVGCIGGVGAFLIETGLTVSLRISDDDFAMTWETFRFMFFDAHNLTLWLIPLGLAVLLRVITHKFHHQLIFPLYFVIIPMLFYIIVAAAQLNLTDLRGDGWIFDMGTDEEPWYKFYSYISLSAIRFGPLWSTLPTQFALLFFNILHPPLNVPALAVSLNDDVDTNKELVAHGYSNLLAGLFGTVPNYLVYVNTLLFYRVGGDNRISGFLLAVATVLLLFIGTGPISFIPVMVVGALIFVLGIDLVKEALWDTRHRVSKTEYITIVSIMICMTVWDFVIGVLFGIIVSCFFFVIQNSQLSSIRAIQTGETAMSGVRRPSLQRAYIREVAKQTTILRLQGFLFFGTITYVEETIRSLIEGPLWQSNPVQFLVLDFTLVAGVDMSSAEALVRVQRLLASKYVILVFCGFTIDSPVGKALQSVEILGAEQVELFSTFNDAMEWTENAYLHAWFRSQKVERSATIFPVPGREGADIEQNNLISAFILSPRHSHIRDAGDRTIANEVSVNQGPERRSEPLNTLIKAFSSYGAVDPVTFRPIEPYLERVTLPATHVLWTQDDRADGLFIIESGLLKATYEFANPARRFVESMVAGTVAGELSALSDSPRNATVVVEHDAVLWKLSNVNLRRLRMEEPELSHIFIQLVLKAAKIDYDILIAAIASRQ